MKRILRINASALKKSSCFRNFWFIINGYKKVPNSVQIEFGSAVHVFAKKMFDTGGDFSQAVFAARQYFETTPMTVDKKKAYLDSVHLVNVCVQYWQWLTEHNSDFEVLANEENKPATELTFSNHFYEDDNYIVYLEGTVDLLGKFKGQYGQYAIADHKTTGSYEHEEYLDNYALSTQLRFYHFNLLLYAKLNPDSFVTQITKYPVGAFIFGIFLNGKASIEFERSEVFQYSKDQIAEFDRLLQKFVRNLITRLTLIGEQMPEPEGILNGACNERYKCTFFNVCRHGCDEVTMKHVLNKSYVKTEYLPLKNSEEKV